VATHGSLVAHEDGVSTGYAIFMTQERGTMFIGPVVDVYRGMVVGENSRDEDMDVNVCKEKHLSNMRASGSDEALVLTPPREMGLEFALEYIVRMNWLRSLRRVSVSASGSSTLTTAVRPAKLEIIVRGEA